MFNLYAMGEGGWRPDKNEMGPKAVAFFDLRDTKKGEALTSPCIAFQKGRTYG